MEITESRREKMDEIDWELIGQTLRAGQYNLLLGAGVSLDSYSSDGMRTLPGAGGLRDELAAAMPGVRANSSLNRLYRTAKQQDRVNELITARFVNCIPGDTVKAITRFKWKRIFTLNVDDALESAYGVALNSQEAKPLNFNDPFEELRDRSKVPIVHLHGYAPKSQEGYIFDIKEYSTSIADLNIWAHNLSSFIRSEPFFILGTSLEEADLTYFLAERFNVPVRSDRAISLFVEPYPDDATSADCAEHKVELYGSTALEFLNLLDGKFPDRTTIKEDLLSDLAEFDTDKLAIKEMAEFHADYEQVPNNSNIGTSQGTNFALGHRATWADLKSDLDIPRDLTSRLQTTVASKIPSGFQIIVGPAGSGKTTVLRRLAYNLSQAGKRCFWHQAIGRVRVASIKAIVDASDEPIYIFVDDFADSVLDYLEIANACQPGKVAIFCAERWYRLDHIKRVAGEDIVKEYALNAVGLGSAKKLIARYNDIGLSEAAPDVEYTYPIQDDPIAIACCRIMHDFKPLAEIVKTSLGHSKDIHQKCYIFASLASYCIRHGVEYSIISREYPNYQVDRMIDEMLPLPLELRERSEVEFITPLNEAFSDSILREWANVRPDDLLAIFVKLSNAVRPRVSLKAIIAGEPNSRLASRLFDYDEVVRPLLGPIRAEQFYTTVKTKWDWNSRYWHQVSHLRMDQAVMSDDAKTAREMADLAVQHAKFTKSIEPDHQFTFTMIGRMLFRKSEVLDALFPSEFLEAIDSLVKAIAIEHRKDRVTVHPYMILFRGVTDGLERGAQLSPDDTSKLSRLIREAARDFPKDKQLRTAGAELRARL